MSELLKVESLADHNLDVENVENNYDWRNLRNGTVVPTASYCDQPFIVKADDGAWVLISTTGAGHEGSRGQHIITKRSFDCGNTWTDNVEVESPNGPEASYAVLFKTQYGRIYCFYTYNKDDMREVKAVGDCYSNSNGMCTRVDTLGAYVFKYSDDNGKSWSENRYEIPVREFEIDRENIYNGKIRFMWNVGKPFSCNNDVYVPLHKVGNFGIGFIERSEGVFLQSKNIQTEKNPEKIIWNTLPDGDIGLRALKGPIAEEQSCVVLSDGSFFCVYRSVDGHPVYSYSRDGGHKWDKPEYMKYHDGRLIKHPRAATFVWKCDNGKYLYWFHNHGGNTYEDRNPAWICMGEEYDTEEGKKIKWSQPEILFYDDDPYIRMSYPDMIEENGEIYISETQKNFARIHKIDKAFLNKLFDYFNHKKVEDDLIYQYIKGEKINGVPNFDSFTKRDFDLPDYSLKDMRKGFTIELSAINDSKNNVLFDTMNKEGKGIQIKINENDRVEFVMCDGKTRTTWISDSNVLNKNEINKISIIVDGGAKIISMIINDKFNDGGAERQFGFGRFSKSMYDVNGIEIPEISNSVEKIRIYDKARMTTEVISN